MRNKILLCLALISVHLTAPARAVRSWTEAELAQGSDLIVIATPLAVTNLDEINSLGWSDVNYLGVETTFKISKVLKGMPVGDQIVFHHYREKAMYSQPNGPGFIYFDPRNAPEYILYLVKDGTNRYAPVAGQIDAVLSIEVATYPLPAALLRAQAADQVAQLDHDRILKLAAKAMSLKPPAITDHLATNSAGGPHDFFSQADYAWPNPAIPGGRPFIGRDGESNPDVFSYHRMAMRDMKDAVAALAAAYVLTGDDKYPGRANEFIKVFFLDPQTRMNPHLQYAQAVLGAQTGNAYGVIDTLHLVELPVAVRFLEKSPAFDPAVDADLKQWFADYIEWITTSTNGVKEMENANNHSIACFVQLASFAKFTGNEKVLTMSRQRFKEVMFPRQMTNDGSFPLELKRTKPYGYSIFQADNLAILCALLSTPDEDFWKFTLPDGRTPKNSVDFIYPYLADKSKWLADGRPKDIMHWNDWPVRQSCLFLAYAETGDEKYFNLWKKLEADPADLEVRRNIAITQPLLWLK